MKEIFQEINEYPWTTFLCWLMVLTLVFEFKRKYKE